MSTWLKEEVKQMVDARKAIDSKITERVEETQNHLMKFVETQSMSITVPEAKGDNDKKNNVVLTSQQFKRVIKHGKQIATALAQLSYIKEVTFPEFIDKQKLLLDKNNIKIKRDI